MLTRPRESAGLLTAPAPLRGRTARKAQRLDWMRRARAAGHDMTAIAAALGITERAARAILPLRDPSTAVEPALLVPFYRAGRPVPLTTTDYALRAKMTMQAARLALRGLVKAGLARACRAGMGEAQIYELTLPSEDARSAGRREGDG